MTDEQEILKLALELSDAKAEIARLREWLDEALEGWEDAAQYKGDYLRDKHGDLEDIARIRAALKPDTGE